MAFPLLVRRTGGDDVEVSARLSDKVEHLAASIAVAVGDAAADTRVCFRGQVLQPAVTLGEAGVSDRHFVVAVVVKRELVWRAASNGTVPAGAVPVGRESNGTPLFLARASKGGGVHPGKVSTALGSCRIGWGGEEHCIDEYEVLCCTGGAVALEAVPHSSGPLPPRALVGGWEADGTRLVAAVGPDPHGGTCPGKTRAGFDGCNVGFGGKEHSLPRHSVLCAPAGVKLPADEVAPPAPELKPCRYLRSVRDLLEWQPSGEAERAPTCLPPLPARPRLLHCHDMKGGYCHDADEGYLSCFGGWGSVDLFCYFSHQRVAVPPACWIEACHARGEGREGVEETALLLSGGEEAAERLAALCLHYGFDGFLVNFESPVPEGAVPAVVEFLQLLSICCKTAAGEHALVLYYDSLDLQGHVSYQNALTEANYSFFEACDGIFTNYWWRAPQLAASAARAHAAGRRNDVYVGVDCFARGVPYSAGPGCRTACEQVANAGLSLALFAPGWSVECGEGKGKEGEDAAACEARFWDALGVGRFFGKK